MKKDKLYQTQIEIMAKELFDTVQKLKHLRVLSPGSSTKLYTEVDPDVDVILNISIKKKEK